jgi:hypothetical protein
MKRRWCLLLTIGLASCGSTPRPLVLPQNLASVWRLQSSHAEPAATAPEMIRAIGTRGWTAATYQGPGKVDLAIYELTSEPGGLEMVQKWRPQANTVVFYTPRYFVAVKYDVPDRAPVNALITALQKLLST